MRINVPLACDAQEPQLQNPVNLGILQIHLDYTSAGESTMKD